MRMTKTTITFFVFCLLSRKTFAGILKICFRSSGAVRKKNNKSMITNTSAECRPVRQLLAFDFGVNNCASIQLSTVLLQGLTEGGIIWSYATFGLPWSLSSCVYDGRNINKRCSVTTMQTNALEFRLGSTMVLRPKVMFSVIELVRLFLLHAGNELGFSFYAQMLD